MRHPGPGESDLLIPNVVIAGGGTYLKSGEVVLAVEVISPSTRLTDTVTKRAVYAKWSIPVWVVIDPMTRTSVWHGDLTGVEWAKDALSAILPPA